MSPFENYQHQIRKELENLLPQNSLFDIIRYHLGLDEEGRFSGKMVRPVLCLVACKAVGGEIARALPVACAIELVHNFSLIHDDIEDGSAFRRHRPTVWKIWGEAQAINAGDALLSLAFLSLSHLQTQPEKSLHIVKILSDTCLKLCQGQFLDIAYEKEKEVSIDDYLKMAEAKTASLFETSLQLGALIGGAKPKVVKHLSLCGQKIGLGFQIQDDCLSLWGERTGKFSPDILRKKKIFPVVYTMERGEERIKNELKEIYAKEFLGEEDVVKVLSLLEKSGIEEECKKMADGYYAQALEELSASGLPISAQGELKEIIDFLKRREI